MSVGNPWFTQAETSFATVRADSIDDEWAQDLRAINFLARAELASGHSHRLTASAIHLARARQRLEQAARAEGVPPAWINLALAAGDRGETLESDHLLPAPWIDHRRRLVRSIRADADRLTRMASADAVRAHRLSVGELVVETTIVLSETDLLCDNMAALRLRAHRMADMIGAAEDERERLWHIPDQRWRDAVAAHRDAEPELFNRWWSAYTDPAVADTAHASIKNIALYAECVSPTGSRGHVRFGPGPPPPGWWLEVAMNELYGDALAAELDALRHILGLEVRENTELEWDEELPGFDGADPALDVGHDPDLEA